MTKLIRTILFCFGSLITLDCFALFILLKFNFGTIVPFLIGLIFLVHSIFWHHIQNLIEIRSWLRQIWQSLWFLFFAWLGSFVLFSITLLNDINKPQTFDQIKAVVILGSGVNGDKPTQTLANRLNKAAPIIKNTTDVITITSGGVGIGRTHSEAYVMANYLHNVHGIAMNQINQEIKSTSTEENLKFSKQILEHKQINPKTDAIVIVTSDFHTMRARAIAKKQGYSNISTAASQTPLNIRFNAWFREYFAFISGWIFGEY